MTKLLLTVLAIGLSGCLASTTPIENRDAPTSDDTRSDHLYEGKHGLKDIEQCSPYLVKVVVDNTVWFVEFPALCVGEPYLYKGDPETNNWERYQGGDPDIQERVVQMARLASELNQ